MTIFGPDISNYEAGLSDLTRLRDASFVFAKCSEGTYYADQSYQSWRRQAQAAGSIFAWYHFLTRENVQAQVANNKACVGDLSLPGMLDIEPAYGYSPTMEQVLAYIDAAHGAGLRLRLAYLPRWFWDQMGQPDLTPIRDRGLYLVSSSYPGGSGSAAQIYPGDGAYGWQEYGGVTPLIYQFTNQALDGGLQMDYNAYLGTQQQLRTHLGDLVILGQDDIQAIAQAVAGYRDTNNEIQLGGKPYAASVYELVVGTWKAVNDPSGGLEQQRAQVNQIFHWNLPTPDQVGAAVAAHLSVGGGATAAEIAQAVEQLFAKALSAQTAPTSATAP